MTDQQFDWHDLFLNAALEPDRWPDALDRMAFQVGASHGQLIGLGGERNIAFNIVTALDEADLQRGIALGGNSPDFNFRIAASGNAMTRGEYDLILDETHYEASKAQLVSDQYVQWCDDMDIPYGCQSGLVVDRVGIIGLATLRKRREGKTTAKQRARFAQATQAARHAVRLQERLEGGQAALLAGAFEAISATAFILDSRGRVQAMTMGAEQHLISGDIALRNHRLSALGTPLSLDQCVAALTADGGLDHVRLRIDLPTDRPPVFMEGFRLPARAWSLGTLPAALLLARPPQRDKAGVAALLTALYQLTPAEADVAIRLFEGYDRIAISDARSVSMETIRTQIKSVYAKTGQSGEADLMRLLGAIMS